VKAKHEVHYGMNRLQLDRCLVALGGELWLKHRQGHVVYSHPLMERTVEGNCRRKDAPGKLVKFVLAVQERLEASQPHGLRRDGDAAHSRQT
jgi:hypothetical protein